MSSGGMTREEMEEVFRERGLRVVRRGSKFSLQNLDPELRRLNDNNGSRILYSAAELEAEAYIAKGRNMLRRLAEEKHAPKWTGTCPRCGQAFRYKRRRRVACSNCCDRFNGGDYSADYELKFTPCGAES